MILQNITKYHFNHGGNVYEKQGIRTLSDRRRRGTSTCGNPHLINFAKRKRFLESLVCQKQGFHFASNS